MNVFFLNRFRYCSSNLLSLLSLIGFYELCSVTNIYVTICNHNNNNYVTLPGC